MKAIVKTILVVAALLVIVATALLGAFRWQAHARETSSRTDAAPGSGRFVRAADVEIFVQELGPPGETLAATAAAGFRAVAMDLPPFGYSERPATPSAYGRQHRARRILAVIDALGVSQATLVGHSFGGGPTMVQGYRARSRCVMAVR